MFRLGEDWNELCSEPTLKQTNELILSPMNIHNIPPLLANAVIKKPDEPVKPAVSISVAQSNDTTTTTSVTNKLESEHLIQSQSQLQLPDSLNSNIEPIESTSHERSTESFPTMANFLPESSYFYNEKNCYIFPGAEIWWNKDSDLESTSSDSSINDDDDDEYDDIEDMEIATTERSEMMGDVETTIAVENLLENTTEHEFNKYLLKRNASTSHSTSLEHIHIQESDIDELSPKRLRTQPESETIEQVNCTSTMCDTLDSSSSTNNPLPPQNEVFSHEKL